MSRIILFNKPYGVLPQFTDKGTEGSPRPTLSQFVDVPGVYPAGRLDMDSEGLMLLTDDGRLQARISDPKYKMAKSYLVQVEGDVAGDALQLVVIDKLPFPSPGDPLAQARSRQIEARGGSAFAQYFLPEAAVALKQGRPADPARKRPRRSGGVRYTPARQELRQAFAAGPATDAPATKPAAV